jgi:glyoxylase-like metal-dependent hydrolase (beta-lactamase superfamily II)
MFDRSVPAAALAAALAWIAPAPAAGACTCDGDATGDAFVDTQDLAAVILAWGPCRGPCPADQNGDRVVDTQDLALVITGWGACREPGGFPQVWINGGTNCGFEPQIQVHQYNEDLYILRQSLCTNFEAPFIYLIFGQDKVLMQDTGATASLPIAATVYGIIDQWLTARGQDSIHLVVTHSHAHGDHVQGDAQFIGQPDTTVVGLSQAAVAQFFGISSWPTQIVQFDLGGRTIDVIPIPGHHPAHIALYERRTGLLLTGDTLYPGRLYISNFPAYMASTQRLVDFTAGVPVCWVLGTHIEMSSTPGVDFPIGSTHHPNEHPLQLTRDHLLELNQAIIDMQDDPHIEVHDEFIIWPF